VLSLHSEFLKSINAIINAIIVCIVITKNEKRKEIVLLYYYALPANRIVPEHSSTKPIIGSVNPSLMPVT
jgi:hypothetical protein